MQDLTPVPKVVASAGAALITSIVIAALVRFGWSDQQAAMIAPGVVEAAVILTPAVMAFIVGYMTPDSDRVRLQRERDEAKEVLEYLQNADKR